MDDSTFFAPAIRSSREELKNEISAVSSNAILSTLLTSLSGLLVIFNQNRQVVAVNEGFLTELGMDDISELFGVRLGEVFNCIHAHETSGGCGTSRFCSTCGAAIAMMATIRDKAKQETLCAMTTTQNGKTQDRALKVTTTPFEIEQELFVLVFLQDVSREQEWLVLEQLFFHDFNNLLTGLIGASELLQYDKFNTEALSIIDQLSWRMKREIDVQKILFQKSIGEYAPRDTTFPVYELFIELHQCIATNNNCEGKQILFDRFTDNVVADRTLLFRVLLNMMLNALEATPQGKAVKISFDSEINSSLFSVWNESVIPQDLQKRVFQRHFSTKAFSGRGLGTYSIKLFGEKYLGGKVWFECVENKGTTFCLRLPRKLTGELAEH